jgi:hypothetical protein
VAALDGQPVQEDRRLGRVCVAGPYRCALAGPIRRVRPLGDGGQPVHFVDGSVVRAHQHAAGARRRPPAAELAARDQAAAGPAPDPPGRGRGRQGLQLSQPAALPAPPRHPDGDPEQVQPAPPARLRPGRLPLARVVPANPSGPSLCVSDRRAFNVRKPCSVGPGVHASCRRAPHRGPADRMRVGEGTGWAPLALA